MIPREIVQQSEFETVDQVFAGQAFVGQETVEAGFEESNNKSKHHPFKIKSWKFRFGRDKETIDHIVTIVSLSLLLGRTVTRHRMKDIV